MITPADTTVAAIESMEWLRPVSAIALAVLALGLFGRLVLGLVRGL